MKDQDQSLSPVGVGGRPVRFGAGEDDGEHDVLEGGDAEDGEVLEADVVLLLVGDERLEPVLAPNAPEHEALSDRTGFGKS